MTRRAARRFGWGALFVSAAAALSGLALSLWFARFVSVALAREDWLGWTATALLGIMVLAAAVIAGREVLGFWRLARLGALKEEAERALRERDLPAERQAVRRIVGLLAGRPELKWPLARLREHQGGVRDAGDLFRLTDRDLLAPLDNDARRLVTRAAKRVSVATAMSPAALFAVLWVLVENVRLIRGLATLYGGPPGLLGTAKLGRMVFTHLVATGGVALTDDLLGQFLGQDLLRRLSRRLGEGLFNGALTARIGTAAIEVTRPLPFIEARPVRARDFLLELTKRQPKDPTPPPEGERRP
jgi:putative membrane protein